MADDFPSTPSTTGALVPGGQVSGTYETSTDSDWFKITLTADNFYRFTLSSGDANYLWRYHGMTIFDSDGHQLSQLYSPRDSTSAFDGVYKAPVTGTYYIGVADQSYQAISNMPYTLKASTGLRDLVGDTSATATPIALGQVIQGTFESAIDIDSYKVRLEADTAYTFAPTWANQPDETIGNHLVVENAAGDMLGNTGYNAVTLGKISFTTTAAGDYTIYAYADDRAASAVTSYQLTATKAPDDYSANTATTGRLAPGMTQEGTVNTPYERDWFAAKLDGGATYWFTLAGVAETSGSGFLAYDAKIRLLDAAGNELGTASTGSSYGVSKITLPFMPAAGGTYYLEVSNTYGSTGKYTVGAAYGMADDYSNERSTAKTIAVNSTWTGNLEVKEDIDAIRIAVTKGKTYVFEVSNSETQALNLQGAQSTDKQADVLIDYRKAGYADYKVFNADYTGDFYLALSGLSQDGAGGYTVRIIEEAADDAGNNTDTAASLAVGKKISAALDYTGDADWFKATLQSGVKYALMLGGWGSDGNTVVFGQDGASLQWRSSGSADSLSLQTQGPNLYTLQAATGGDYYFGISQSAYYSGGYGNMPYDGTGTYSLSLVALSSDVTAPSTPKIVAGSGAQVLTPFDDICITFDEPVIIVNGSFGLKTGQGQNLAAFSASTSNLQSNGTVLKLRPYGNLQPGAKYIVEMDPGAFTDLAGNKYTGPVQLSFTTVVTAAKSSPGNDYLSGMGDVKQLDGGAGIDTVMYSNQRAFYGITNSATETRVSVSNNSQQPDVLTHVERLLFNDSAVALDISGTGGQAYRLYQAAFNRTPDKAGVGYWIAQMDKGAGLRDVAQSFINSSEFSSLYGAAPADATFVSQLYQNVLHRAGEQAGIDYWSGILATGTPRAEILAWFSEGEENQAALLKLIGNGFDYIPYG